MKAGGEIAFEGKDVEEEKYICPTVLKNVKLTDPIMKDEVKLTN